MVFSFNSQLKFIIPVGKGTCRICTLDTSVTRDTLVDAVKFWFPTLPQIVTNMRQGRLRAYHSMPEYFLLKYEEQEIVEGRQRWMQLFTIKAYRNCVIEVTELRSGRTRVYS